MKPRFPKPQFKMMWPRRISEFTYQHHHKIRRAVRYLLSIILTLYLITVVVSQVRINQREQYLPYQLASAEFGQFFSFGASQVYYESYSAIPSTTSLTSVNTGSEKFLLVHGFGASSLSWRYQVDYLRNFGQVVTVDLMGFGLSQQIDMSGLGSENQAEMLNALLLHLGWPQAIVIGHSLGGGVALRLALNHPQKVENLILVDSVDLADIGPNLSGLSFMNGAFAAQIPLGLADGRSLVASTLAAAVYQDSEIDDAWIESYYRAFTIRGATANLIAQGLAPQRNRLAELGKITQPVLIISGEHDTFVPEQMGANLQAGLPQGFETVEIPGAGHNPQEEDPIVFNQVVGEWVNRLK